MGACQKWWMHVRNDEPHSHQSHVRLSICGSYQWGMEFFIMLNFKSHLFGGDIPELQWTCLDMQSMPAKVVMTGMLHLSCCIHEQVQPWVDGVLWQSQVPKQPPSPQIKQQGKLLPWLFSQVLQRECAHLETKEKIHTTVWLSVKKKKKNHSVIQSWRLEKNN